jgi:signal transduction histidine kinase
VRNKMTDNQQHTDDRAKTLWASLRLQFLVEKDPPDSAYRQRHAAEMIEGFRVLSFLVFASMSVLLGVHLVQPQTAAAATNEAPTAFACALLASAGGVGLMASKSVRSPKTAFTAAAALLAAGAIVLSVDTLERIASQGRSTSSLVPVIFSILVLGAAVLPLRPSRVLALGTILIASSAITAGLMNVPFQGDVVDAVSAVTAVAVSVVIAAKSTSHRIRIYQAHVSTIQSEREAEGARERTLLAESAITMERLAASLSHELNTPIGALKSATDTLTRAVQRHASFPPGSRILEIVDELTSAIRDSTARLNETVARIQRFANLDRSTVRLVDINQLVQDAVALMNPPSVNQTRVKMNLKPLPQIWCRPHGLSVAIASILNTALENSLPAAIDTYTEGCAVVVRITRPSAAGDVHDESELGFAVAGGRVRASGWNLFAARQLVNETGGALRLNDKLDPDNQVITITLSGLGVPGGKVPEDGSRGAA